MLHSHILLRELPTEVWKNRLRPNVQTFRICSPLEHTLPQRESYITTTSDSNE